MQNKYCIIISQYNRRVTISWPIAENPDTLHRVFHRLCGKLCPKYIAQLAGEQIIEEITKKHAKLLIFLIAHISVNSYSKTPV